MKNHNYIALKESKYTVRVATMKTQFLWNVVIKCKKERIHFTMVGIRVELSHIRDCQGLKELRAFHLLYCCLHLVIVHR